MRNVCQQGVLYELPHSEVKPGDVVRAEEDNGLVMFYSADDGRLVYKCSKSMDGKIVICEQEREKVDSVGMTSFKRTFSQYGCYEEFMAGFEKVPLVKLVL